jgi:hypothetical protein
MTTRRLFLLAIASTPLFADTSSPRNQLSNSGNEFQAGYKVWADKMNAAKENPLTIPADAVAAFDPLPQFWRKVEHKFRIWVRGY